MLDGANHPGRVLMCGMARNGPTARARESNSASNCSTGPEPAPTPPDPSSTGRAPQTTATAPGWKGTAPAYDNGCGLLDGDQPGPGKSRACLDSDRAPFDNPCAHFDKGRAPFDNDQPKILTLSAAGGYLSTRGQPAPVQGGKRSSLGYHSSNPPPHRPGQRRRATTSVPSTPRPAQRVSSPGPPRPPAGRRPTSKVQHSPPRVQQSTT